MLYNHLIPDMTLLRKNAGGVIDIQGCAEDEEEEEKEEEEVNERDAYQVAYGRSVTRSSRPLWQD